MLDESLDFALEFLTAHPTWYIFPIRRLEKDPPLIKNNLAEASNDPKIIKQWHAKWRGCNWGLALRKSSVLVMDVDRKPGKVGQDTFDNLTLEFGELPATLTVRSPSGGLHYYFTGEHRFGLGKYGFGPDIDSPNYVLIPGCWLCTNSVQGYEVIADEPVAPAPAWFGEFLKEKAEKQAADTNPAVDLDRDPNVERMIRYLQEGAPKCIQGQNGEKVLFDVSCVLKDNGVSESRAIELIATYYNTPEHCDPLWNVGIGAEADRLDLKVHNAYQYARENTAGSATAEFQFGDPDNVIDPAEIAEMSKLWDKRLRDQTKAKTKKSYEKRFTDEARDIDPLTGEPFEESTPLDPLTGEPYEDPTPPKGGPGATPKGAADAKGAGGGGGNPRVNNAWVKANWIWVVGMERFIRLSDGMLWSCKQFDSYYNHLATRSSYSSALFATTDGIRKAERLVYRPGLDVLLDDGKSVNLWRPSKVIPKEGSTDIWNEHLNYLFQDEADKERVLNWMAWVYQNQARKPNHGLLLVGRNTGTGKSFVARVLEQLIGPDNTQRPKNSSLKGDFNSWALQCKLCIIEELMQIGRREVANELRDTITESTIEVNVKNISAQKIENYMAMMAITNHRDAMPMDETERRWLVVETFARRKGGDYYRRLWPVLESLDSLGAIAYELQNRKLGDYDASLSPEDTGARNQMIELSRSDVESWLYENAGNPPLSRNLTTIQDVVNAMPAGLQRQPRVRSVVQTYFRDKLNGVQLDKQARTSDGSKVRVWALHGRAVMLAGMSDVQLGNMYAAERNQPGGSKSAEEQAVEDFGSD